jgi:NAD(P)-dependent dehydrogenase (short-subunit alcohol dehydrogenase family)
MMTAEQRGPATVLVTGASRGIGAAIATRMAKDGYGVVVNYAADAAGAEAVVTAIRDGGGRAIAVRADVASPGDVAEMFRRAREEMGPLAALVNNAGVTGEEAPVEEQDAAALTQLMQTNVVGPVLCAKHAVQAMSTTHGGQGGCIVNVASVAARTGGLPGLVPYAATKGALITMTKGLANEVAAEGIRVNSVSPGLVDTELADRPGITDIAAHTPLGRMGRPEEIASAVSWLVSPAASFVTGSDIAVSGGR